jgi:hypothetical protein
MKFKILIDNVDMTENVSIPLSDQLTLDESLDFGSLKLCYLEKSEPYKPLTSVVITLDFENNTKEEYYYFIASDTCEEYIQTGKFTHTLMLIEQTKWLERFMGRTHPITQPKQSVVEPSYVVASKENLLNNTVEPVLLEDIKTPMKVGSFTFENAYTFLTRYVQQGVLNWRIRIYRNDKLIYEKEKELENVTLELTKGVYTVEYAGGYVASANYNVYYEIDVRENEIVTRPQKTITSEVNNVLATIETLWTNETPRFSFNQEQAEKYKDTIIPEITLTGTLFEQLKQIGSCIHSIPKLKNNVIYFIELGSEELAEGTTIKGGPLEQYMSSSQSFNIEQYAIAIDSNIDNFVNGDNIEYGSVVEPYVDGFKTVRTEKNTVQLTDDNILIETQYPIEKVISVVIGYLNKDEFINIDLKDYIYEGREYEALSSINDTYPFSKAYALRYDVGQKNIKGLNFKLPNAISYALENYSIINIVRNAQSRTATVDKIKELLLDLKIAEIKNLQFRVTYVPIINGRAKQFKTSIKDFTTMSVLPYNQSSQKINARAMGEAMRSAVEKLGNPELVKMFLIPTKSNYYLQDLQVGKMFDEQYYISVIKREFYYDFIKLELGLSKNFNKLNEYVGLDKQIRFYEISEQQVENTQILYEEFCVIGDTLNKYDENVAVSLTSIANSLTNVEQNKISSVMATGYSNGKQLEKIILPVVTYPIGNSVLITFGYDDNFSAGNRVVEKRSTTVQYQVQYTDENGEIDNLKIEYGQYHKDSSYSYTEVIAEGNSLPLADEVKYGEFSSNMNLEVVINKENRAVPTFNYMLHFVTNRDDIVIGEAMARYCYITSTDNNPVNVYVFDRKLSKYDYILEGGTLVGQLSVYEQAYKQYIKFNSISFNLQTPKKSWAVVKEIDGKKHLLFGQNINLLRTDIINLPKLNFTHILY